MQHRMKKRIFCLLLVLVLALGLLSVTALAAGTGYGIWVNGEEFTDTTLTIACGKGTAVYAPDSRTITLQNAEITKTYNPTGEDDGSTYGIYIAPEAGTDKVSLYLKGTNTLKVTGTTGVYAGAPLEISADSKTAMQRFTADQTCFAAAEALTLKNITLIAQAAGRVFQAKSLTLDGVILKTTQTGESTGYAVESQGDISVRDCTWLLTADTNGMYAAGKADFSGSKVVLTSASDNGLHAEGGVSVTKSELDTTARQISLYGKSLTVSDRGTVEATQVTDTGAVYAIKTKENVTVTDSVLEATSQYYGIWAEGETAFTGSEVTVSAAGSYGIRSKAVSAASTKLTVTAQGIGIYTENDLTISKKSTVTATQSGDTSFTFAANIHGNVTVSDSTFQATADGEALYAQTGVTLTNADVTLTSGQGIGLFIPSGSVTATGSKLKIRGTTLGISARGVTISDKSTVEVTQEENTDNVYAIYVTSYKGACTVRDSDLTATSEGIAVSSPNVALDKANVTLTGTGALTAEKSLQVTGGTKLTAVGNLYVYSNGEFSVGAAEMDVRLPDSDTGTALTRQPTLQAGCELTLAEGWRGKDAEKETLPLTGTDGFQNYWHIHFISENTAPVAPDAPAISPEGGSFLDAQTVTLTAEADAEIHYTLDGTDPTTSATAQTYTAPFTLDRSAAVKAAALRESLWSEVTTAEFTREYLPDAPTDVRVMAGNSQVTVSFRAPADTGTAPISGYRVYVYEDGAGTPAASVPVTESPASVTGLENGKTYHFRVAAITSVGEGPKSAASASVVPAAPDMNFDIVVSSGKNGSVSASHKTAVPGTKITLTIKPDKGYTLETLRVLNKQGKEIDLNAVTIGGKYTFRMPAGKVTVEATFQEDNSMLNYFIDVNARDYYYDPVLWAAENGITQGTDSLHFSPDGSCTRAQAVTFLWRAAGSPDPGTSAMPFRDVKAGSYYYKAVLWATENGIAKGTGKTTFSPDTVCTRAQIVTFLYRSAQANGNGMQGAWMFRNPFTDVDMDAYYAEAVLWAVANGVTEGTGKTTFSPDATCTRAQIVTFLYRAMQ